MWASSLVYNPTPHCLALCIVGLGAVGHHAVHCTTTCSMPHSNAWHTMRCYAVDHTSLCRTLCRYMVHCASSCPAKCLGRFTGVLAQPTAVCCAMWHAACRHAAHRTSLSTGCCSAVTLQHGSIGRRQCWALGAAVLGLAVRQHWVLQRSDAAAAVLGVAVLGLAVQQHWVLQHGDATTAVLGAVVLGVEVE
ncbi:hypothetical protein SELMODRAFT_417735 [Selaginella moellendorffii]|uniref:Uncharacterized protein n=1 Tax=Selaginella moellendorffii TaxID=88036 RepID=D8S3F7_SELML|nr:hypothetical protein SELMODRAFT_417735 [Selaginella moellendorffii]